MALGWEGFAALLQARHVVPSFVSLVLVVGLEAVLPLAAGIALATLAVHDTALEVLVTLPAPYRMTAICRMALVLAWALSLEAAATWVTYQLFPTAIPKPGPVALLAWLAPTLWLSAGGVLVAYGLRSRSASSAVLGCIWVAQLAFHGYFAAFGWTQPWFLFTTTFAPAAAFWQLNRLELLVTALFFAFADWVYLGNVERRFLSEDV